MPVSVHLFEVWTTRLAWSCFTVTKTETTKDWINFLKTIESNIFLRSLLRRLYKRNHFCWRVGYVLATKLREVVSIAEVSYAVPTRSISPTREAMQGYADWEVGYAKCFHTNFPKKKLLNSKWLLLLVKSASQGTQSAFPSWLPHFRNRRPSETGSYSEKPCGRVPGNNLIKFNESNVASSCWLL